MSNGVVVISSFPVVRYRMVWTVSTPMRFPEYAGSALRGVFGAALRRLACITGERQCTGCGLLRSCPYSLIFETPAPLLLPGEKPFGVTPNPYIIEPPPWGERSLSPGERLIFHMVLAGRAIAQAPLLFFAWQQALAQGVGPGNGTAELAWVDIEKIGGERERILIREEGLLHDHEALVFLPSWDGDEHLELELDVPLRLQRKGSPLGSGQVSPRDFLTTLMRRVSQIARIHAGVTWDLDYTELASKASLVEGSAQLRWRDWTRRSGRQGQTMALGGVVGSWILRGDLEPFWPFLYFGQWLHVGKNATFGLGKYRLHGVES